MVLYLYLAGLELGVLALDTGLDERGVAEDEDERGADDPEERAEGLCPPDERDADDEEDGVERFLGYDVFSDWQHGVRLEWNEWKNATDPAWVPVL